MTKHLVSRLATQSRIVSLGTSIVVFGLLSAAGFGQTDSWKGGAGNWNDATKWTAGVPTSSSSVFVDHGTVGASSVTVSDNESSGNLTIDSDDNVTLVTGARLNVFGPTISNAGTISIAATSSQASLDITGAVTLAGAGILTMSNNANNGICFNCVQNTGNTLTNQSTIQGAGTIGPNCGNTFNNQATVNASQSTPLIISICNGPSTNTGTLEATNGGTLILQGNTQGGGTFDNTGGTIHADAGSTVVLFDSAIVKNGALTSSSTGLTQGNGNNGSPMLDGVTISGTHQVIAHERLANTITNSGSHQVGTSTTPGSLDIVGSVTLKGTGTMTMSNLANNAICFNCVVNTGNTLTNQGTIQGSGSISPGTSNTFVNQHIVNANQTTQLNISVGNGTVPNTGTLEATNGGTLLLEAGDGGGTFDNTGGGTIHADAGSTVVLFTSAIVKNGNLTSTSTGMTQCNGNNGRCTLDGVAISGTHQVIAHEAFNNIVTNNGSFHLGTSVTPGALDIVGSVTLKGTGTMTMSNLASNAICFNCVVNSGNTLTNQSTIQGMGSINPGSTNTFVNQHIVSATQNLTINGNFSNPGTLKVSKGKTLYISGGLFTNFSGNTLTGGKYMATGSLLFDGASIVKNAAGITLTGTSALIGNQSAANALANFASNASTGSFTVSAGQQFVTTLNSNFSNAGKVTVGKNSGLKVMCNPTFTCVYTQTAGMTTVDGVLTAAQGVNIQGGGLFGTGTVAGSVVSKASVTAGDSLAKAGKLSLTAYTQQATGSLNIQIGGLTAGTQYSQLAVANGASLNGTLTLKLINSFIPAVGDTFTILTTSARTGTFATVKGLSINSAEHFQINYGPTSVTAVVMSGP